MRYRWGLEGVSGLADGMDWGIIGACIPFAGVEVQVCAEGGGLAEVAVASGEWRLWLW